MASTVATRRPIVGILFIVAGAIVLLGLLLSLFPGGVALPFSNFLVDVALGLAFVFLALVRSSSSLLRAAFVVAAVGWLVLALAALIPGLGVVNTLALLVALVGSLASGILVFLRGTFGRRTNLWFLIAMIITAVDLLLAVTGNSFGIGALIALIWGAALVVAGFFILRFH